MCGPDDGTEKKSFHLAYEHEGLRAMRNALDRLLGIHRHREGGMPHACADFKASMLGGYTASTRKQYEDYLDVIASAFADFDVSQVTPPVITKFLWDYFGCEGKKNTGRKYIGLMTRLFIHVQSSKGWIKDNPMDGVDTSFYRTKRRKALPTHEQIQAIRDASLLSKPHPITGRQLPTPSGPMFCCMIDMAYLTWARAIDIRLLHESAIDRERNVIHLQPLKTLESSGKEIEITITPAIQAVLDEARRIRRQYGVDTGYIFPKPNGAPYSKRGLFSMWDRARDCARITDDVRFMDLRALGATDAKRKGTENEAIRKRLGHTDIKTTEIYLRELIPEQSDLDLDLPW